MRTAQQEFDQRYVSSLEICRRIGITSSGLTLAQQRNAFPRPTIRVGKSWGLWERNLIEPVIRQREQKRQAASA